MEYKRGGMNLKIDKWSIWNKNERLGKFEKLKWGDGIKTGRILLFFWLEKLEKLISGNRTNIQDPRVHN